MHDKFEIIIKKYTNIYRKEVNKNVLYIMILQHNLNFKKNALIKYRSVLQKN